MNNTLELIADLVDKDQDKFSSCQIARALKQAIDRGKILPGTMLPSARELAARLGVSRSTAHRSFQTLTSQGYIKSRIGKASQVQNPFLKTCLAKDNVTNQSIDFSPVRSDCEGAFSDNELLELDFDSIDQPVLNRMRFVIGDFNRNMAAMKNDALMGSPLLRQSLSDYLLRSRLVSSTEYDIAVLSGPSIRTELLISLLVNAGDRVAVPEDSDELLIERLEVHGADIRTIRCDENGMRVDALSINDDAPALVFITPSRGAVMSLERRKYLAEWAQETGSLIIEDDCESYRSSGTACLPAVQSFQPGGRVIYLPAPPTVLFPLLKVSAVVLPPALVRPFLALKRFVDPETSHFEQSMWQAVLASGHFESMIAKIRTKTASSNSGELPRAPIGVSNMEFETFSKPPAMLQEGGLMLEMRS